MKPSEEWAKKKLGEYLTQKGTAFTIREGGASPDLIVDASDGQWAVEVTELHSYVDDGGEKSTLGVEARLFKLFERIKRLTPNRARGYVVSLKGPLQKDLERDFQRAAVNHINGAREAPLAMGHGNACELTPLEKGNDLHWAIMVDGTAKTPQGDALLADIQATIDYAIGRILGEKVPRLAQSKAARRVLVIVCDYFFADSDNVRRGLEKRRSEITPINQVFLAWNDEFDCVYP